MGISRLELFKTLGIVSTGIRLDPVVEAAYVAEEKRLWAMQHDDTAVERGGAWHTSFHASAFSGEGKECARKLVYGLMNVPDPEPFSPDGRSYMDIGKALEYQIVYRLARMGKTVSGSCPLWDGAYLAQTRFELPDLWLAGSTDCVLDLRPMTNCVVPFDVKGKDPDRVTELRVGVKPYDPDHYAQIQMYVLFCRLYHEDMGWADMGLEKAEGGVIFYAARNKPRHVAEFWFDYDPAFCMMAMQTYATAKLHFLGNSLPQRPKEWMWTQSPCDWCDFKKWACKPDVKAEVTLLTDSKAIEFARSVNPTYSYEQIREDVLRRWDMEQHEEKEAA